MFVLRGLLASNITRAVNNNIVRYTKKDPGVSRRKKIVETPEYDQDLDFDDLESDFMNVGKSHLRYEDEETKRKEQMKYHIVKQKYFKEKYPNFLTWHDKEQIKYLYRTDPEQWTIEYLAESFPALPETIKKIVDGNWTKTKQNKITNHDRTVQENWEKYKNGKLNELPPVLAEHLNKFSNRALNFKPFEIPDVKGKNIKTASKNISTEFSDIITSYKKLKNNNEEEETINFKSNSPPEETSFKSKRSGETVTLDQLKHTIKEKVSQGKEIEEYDKLILQKEMKAVSKIESKNVDLMDFKSTKKYENYVSTKVKTPQSALTQYPEKITIPAKVFRKGRLYKLNDCFYDDDGTFLYRVPGLYNLV